jgi:hypothetical protein
VPISVGAVIVVFVAYLWLVWRGAPWLDGTRLRELTPSGQESAVDAIRGRLIQIGAGVVASAALIYTGLNYRLSRENHVTDRYMKAIEQLGSDRLDVRLGAIYALERIMIDSARDHPTIVEVLAAFVREHTTRIAANAKDAGRLTRRMPFAATEEDAERAEALPATPRTDVQAAMTVLGRRPQGREERGPVNLRGAILADVNLDNAQFNSANLSRANLAGASFYQASLVNATFRDADLRGADMSWSDLTGATLIRANLDDADVYGAKLAHTNLIRASADGMKVREGALSAAVTKDMTGSPDYHTLRRRRRMGD